MPRRLSQDQFDEFRGLVASPRQTEGDRRREEKKALSQERMKKWPDTLEAQRKRKQDNYKLRMAAQEAVRQQTDAEEDTRRAQERKDIIDYATRTIYKNTDKMKRLSSAELLSECLYVRDRQVELRQKIREVEAEWEAQFEVMIKANGAKQLAREKKETKERSDMAKHIAQVQQEQLAEVRARFEQELLDQEAEGTRLLALAAEAEKEEIAKQKHKEHLGKQNQLAVVRANQEVKKLKAELAARDAAEDATIAAYARAKDELKKRRDTQFAKIEGEKQQRREEMIEQGTRRLEALNLSNNMRLDREVAEKRREEDARMIRLSEKRAAFARTIDQSRRTQLERKEEATKVEAEKDRVAAQRWRQYNVQAEATEKMELEAEYRQAKRHQQILRNQAEDKGVRDVNVRRTEVHEARTLETQAETDLASFKRVARERIAHFKDQGKNTYPLEKTLRDISRGR